MPAANPAKANTWTIAAVSGWSAIGESSRDLFQIGQVRRFRSGDQPKAPRVDKMTINRSRVERLSGLAPAKAWGKEKDGERQAETVEQFQARGGQVQRLTASWEQRA